MLYQQVGPIIIVSVQSLNLIMCVMVGKIMIRKICYVLFDCATMGHMGLLIFVVNFS